MGDHHAVDAHVAAGCDNGERLARRQVAGVNYQFLFSTDFAPERMPFRVRESPPIAARTTQRPRMPSRKSP